MKTQSLTYVLLLVATTIQGCSSKSGSGSSTAPLVQVACTIEGVCVQTKGIPEPDLAALETDCTNTGGKATNSCPTADLVSCCTEPEDDAGTMIQISCTYDDGGTGTLTSTGACKDQ